MHGTRTKVQVTYGDAWARGQLRLWKQRLHQQYLIFNAGFRDRNNRDVMLDFAKRRTDKGRRRALKKLKELFGPGARLAGLLLEGKHPVAVWSVLKPRDAVTVAASQESGLAQDCVAVNYAMVGWLPDQRPRFGEGLWTLEVPDHALGRAIERSRRAPEAIVREAHANLLRLPQATVFGLKTPIVKRHGMLSSPSFLVRAGPGGFGCHILIGSDESLDDDCWVARVRAGTWLAEDMLHDGQILLDGTGPRGTRLGDGLLLPFPLQRIVEGDGKKQWGIVSCLPIDLCRADDGGG